MLCLLTCRLGLTPFGMPGQAGDLQLSSRRPAGVIFPWHCSCCAMLCTCRKVLWNKNFWECHYLCIPGTEAVMKQPSPTTPKEGLSGSSASFFQVQLPYHRRKCLWDIITCILSVGCCFEGALPSPCCLWQGKMPLLLPWISVRAVEHLMGISCVKARTPHIGIMG